MSRITSVDYSAICFDLGLLISKTGEIPRLQSRSPSWAGRRSECQGRNALISCMHSGGTSSFGGRDATNYLLNRTAQSLEVGAARCHKIDRATGLTVSLVRFCPAQWLQSRQSSYWLGYFSDRLMFTIPAASAGVGRMQAHINALRRKAKPKTLAKCQEVRPLIVEAKELLHN
jgi:hypothetical protein